MVSLLCQFCEHAHRITPLTREHEHVVEHGAQVGPYQSLCACLLSSITLLCHSNEDAPCLDWSPYNKSRELYTKRAYTQHNS